MNKVNIQSLARTKLTCVYIQWTYRVIIIASVPVIIESCAVIIDKATPAHSISSCFFQWCSEVLKRITKPIKTEDEKRWCKATVLVRLSYFSSQHCQFHHISPSHQRVNLSKHHNQGSTYNYILQMKLQKGKLSRKQTVHNTKTVL